MTQNFEHYQELVENYKKRDFYRLLQENKTLSASELRRPIFAYMIYQLIINNIDFSVIGKIGVYLSFLNLLTKDAKHIHDTNYKVNLEQEFKFRNLLHSISALWMYQRRQGKQGILKKADICRVLDGENKRETDAEILKRYKGQKVIEIQFLSHSYFGEKDNVLHFQHQSFAEILLAEYYLKVFIKYALDEDSNVEEARTKLILGEPTAQTIQFLTEMLSLLKETATRDDSTSVLEKRKLLYPLMASLATKENNKLFCNDIHYDWFMKYPCKENEVNFPKKALQNWCIDGNKLDKIIKLARDILESKTNYLLTQAETKSALYDKELLVIQTSLSSPPPDIDRWLALLVGNILHNDSESKKYFNWNIINYSHLFDLIRNWNYSFQQSAPYWGKEYFIGINMSRNSSMCRMDNLDLRGINFSHSNIHNTTFHGSDISHCDFTDCLNLEDVDFRGASVLGTTMNDEFVAKLLRGDMQIYYLYRTYVEENKEPFIVKCTREYVDMNEGNVYYVEYTPEPYTSLTQYGLRNKSFTEADVKYWFDEGNDS